MRKIALLFALLFTVPGFGQSLLVHESIQPSSAPLENPSAAQASPLLNHSPPGADSTLLFSARSAHGVSAEPAQILEPKLGAPIFIQIFKQERQLELYSQVGEKFQLVRSFPICKFSGGLGPKKIQGDFKSPEGFYQVTSSQLHPDSHYYRAINLGFPNQYDREHGYNGNYLMIHGDCVSIGCYAMTNEGIEQIYNYAQAALRQGQRQININIYPFKMTAENMRRHINSNNLNFWQQLKPGYDYFVQHQRPPSMQVINGVYVLSHPQSSNPAPGNPFNPLN